MNFLAGFIFSSLLASTITIQSPETSDVDFQNHTLKGQNRLSYVDYYKRNHGKSPELDQSLKQAQFEFLKGSLEKARAHYQAVCEIRHEKVWSLSDRKKIFYACFRWAQLTGNLNEKKSILQEILVFDGALEPDSSLFPPPLIGDFNQLKERTKVQVWSLPENSEKFDQILINGEALEGRTGFFRRRPGNRKVIFLSNKYQPFEVTTSMENLQSLNLNPTPLASGDCNSSEINVSIQKSDSFEIFNPECGETLHPLVARSPMESKPQFQSQSGKERSIFKNPWFWAGVSVMAGGLIYYHLNQNQNNSHPAEPPPSQPVVYTN